MTERQCGTCTFCCKVMYIPELEKPGGTWCRFCKPGQGCTAYDTRPDPCRVFQCQWLADPAIGEDMRPDRVKVVLTVGNNGRRMIANCDPNDPLAWKREPVHSRLKTLARHVWPTGGEVQARAGNRRWVITPGEDLDLGNIHPQSRYRVTEGPAGKFSVSITPFVEPS